MEWVRCTLFSPTVPGLMWPDSVSLTGQARSKVIDDSDFWYSSLRRTAINQSKLLPMLSELCGFGDFQELEIAQEHNSGGSKWLRVSTSVSEYAFPSSLFNISFLVLSALLVHWRHHTLRHDHVVTVWCLLTFLPTQHNCLLQYMFCGQPVSLRPPLINVYKFGHHTTHSAVQNKGLVKSALYCCVILKAAASPFPESSTPTGSPRFSSHRYSKNYPQ